MGRTLAEYVRARRQERGLSLRTLAERAEVSKSALHAWERGLQSPSLPELDALLRTYGTTPEERADVLRLIDAPRAHRELLRTETNALGSRPSVSGDLLRALRLRRGLSISATARLLGVPASTVLRWERGEIWPSPERLTDLLATLDAHTDERIVLLDAREIEAPRRRGDLDEIARILYEFEHWSGVGEPMPFVELRLATAAIDLWPLVGRWPAAEEMYRRANADLGCWALIAHGALDDAVHYARRALAGEDGTTPAPILAWPAHILAKNAAYGGRRDRPAAGAAALEGFRARYEGDEGLLAWYQRDLAEFYTDAGDLDAGLALSVAARETTDRAGDPTENAEFDHARVLIRARRYDEALRLLPPPRRTVPLQDANEAIAWAEALLGIGERAGAASSLATARTLVEGRGLSGLDVEIEALVRQIEG